MNLNTLNEKAKIRQTDEMVDKEVEGWGKDVQTFKYNQLAMHLLQQHYNIVSHKSKESMLINAKTSDEVMVKYSEIFTVENAKMKDDKKQKFTELEVI